MNIPTDLRYTNSHEWVRVEGDTLIVGITDFAQDQLGDLTFVELPPLDDALEAGGEAAVIESVKAASEIYSPVAGTISAVNDALEMKPELINQDPYGEGWIFKLTAENVEDAEALLDAEAYQTLAPQKS